MRLQRDRDFVCRVRPCGHSRSLCDCRQQLGQIENGSSLYPGHTVPPFFRKQACNGQCKARLAHAATSAIIERAHDLLGLVGLGRIAQKIETMSRGEMQRVAIARALLRKPGVIVADEPTASLDAESGDAVGDLLLDLAIAERSTLIVVSHDLRLASRLDRRLTFRSGRIVEDSAMKGAAA